jgi:hypothetical protein
MADRLDLLAEALVLVKMLKGEEIYIKRLKNLLYYVMVSEYQKQSTSRWFVIRVKRRNLINVFAS